MQWLTVLKMLALGCTTKYAAVEGDEDDRYSRC